MVGFERDRERMCAVQRIVGLVVAVMAAMVMMVACSQSHDYGDALSKSILFFEGQRSGKLPSSQRMTWRKDSALRDGYEIGVSLSFSLVYVGSFLNFTDSYYYTNHLELLRIFIIINKNQT